MITEYLSAGVGGNPLNFNNVLYAALPPYNVKADGKMVTDAAITAGQATLTSASASFTGGDRGKLVAVYGAGATASDTLFATINLVANATTVLLSATAGTTVTNAECSYGTDQTAAATQCITDGVAAGARAEFPWGDICITAPLANTGLPAQIEGQGVLELYGGLTTTNDANWPTIAPYLRGTVFVVMAPNVDAYHLLAVGRSQTLRNFGIRFAGKFKATGHGVWSVPGSAGGTGLGNIGGIFENVRVFGHDGDHYGFYVENAELMGWNTLRGYGGGCFRYVVGAGSPGSPGNLTAMNIYGAVFVNGSAHTYSIEGPAGGGSFQSCVFTELEGCVRIANPAIAGVTPPTNAQRCLNTVNGSAMLQMGFVNCGFETDVGGAVTFPSGPGCYRTGDPASVTSNALPTTSPTTKTSAQNVNGKFLLGYHAFVLTPAASATVSTTLSAQANAGATQLQVASSTGFAAGQGIQIDTGTSIEFAIIDSVPDGTHLNLVESTGFGLSLTHLNGASVAAGAAVVIGQSSVSNTFPGSQKPAWHALAIAAPAHTVTVVLPIPANWWFRLDWANAQRMWTEYTGTLG